MRLSCYAKWPEWAKEMAVFLREINQAVSDAGGCLDSITADRSRYRTLLEGAQALSVGFVIFRFGKHSKLPQAVDQLFSMPM